MAKLQKMGDCNLNLSYQTAPGKIEEKFCKYNYSTWCATCERSSPRRRSKSETNEPCRRKGKDPKTATPKRFQQHEFENMDLEFNKLKHDIPYVDCCRLRANLCELPTSYISNNCPSPQSTLKFVDLNAQLPSFPSGNDPKQHLFVHPKLRKNKPTGVASATKAIMTPTYYDYRNANYPQVYSLPLNNASTEVDMLRDKLLAISSTALPATPPSYATCERVTPIVPVLQATNRNTTKFKQDRLASSTPPLTPVIGKRPKVKTAKSRLCTNIGPLVPMRMRRHKMATMAALASKLTTSDSEESDGEVSDEEDDASDLDDESGTNDPEERDLSLSDPEDSNKDSSDTTLSFGSQKGSSGDCVSWPTRPSLFPHIPPYIKFNSHDSEIVVKLPTGRKFFKWRLSTITPIIVRKTLSNSGFALVRKSNQWLGTWGKHMKSPMFRTLRETQKLNHFPGTFQLGRKDKLWRNFQRLINRFGLKEFGFLPHTYILPLELKLLKHNWFKNGSGGEMWIIKPPASARGAGIRVINKWSQLPKKTSLVVQKYISNPLLINGSKFDLRLYVLVTSFHPLRIYLYPDGLARFASAKYSDDAKDLKDVYMHLTNYSINKLSSQYTANEDANACQGHKWTISKLMEYLQERGTNTKALWTSLQELAIKTILSAEAPITQLCEENQNSLYNCYELFGIDVLLDEHLKPWLLEVNISPSLHSASPLDAHVKGPMVQMLFDLAQFHFPPRLASASRTAPVCYDSKLYTPNLTGREKNKHDLFTKFQRREDYLENILDELNGDDVRHLTRAEDEFVAKGRFERIFPSASSYRYLEFMETRYYNRLFDAWETKYENNRQEGISLLQSLCAQKVHLKAAPKSLLVKNLPNMIPGESAVPMSQLKSSQTRPLEEIMEKTSITNKLSTVSNGW